MQWNNITYSIYNINCGGGENMRKKLWLIVSVLLLVVSVILLIGKWKYNYEINMIGFIVLIIINLLNIFDSFIQNKNK